MATTTLTSFTKSKPQSKELCSFCGEQPYDLICTCGDKFDFTCIQHHVEHLGVEFQDEYQKASERLEQLNDLKSQENNNTGAARTLIENWKRKRIEDINDIAEKALNDNQREENMFQEVEIFQQVFNQLSTELHRIVHENLNTLIQLNRDMKAKCENFEDVPEILNDDASLDALLRSKLNPLSSSNQNSITNEHEPTERFSSLPKTEFRREISRTESTRPISYTERTETVNHTEPTSNHTELQTEVDYFEPTTELKNPNDSTNDYTDDDEFDAGLTRYIRRNNPISIPANNDKYAATVCFHNNQLLYLESDRTTQSYRLIFIRDITNPSSKQTIDWNTPDTTTNVDDDEWVQDIIYSEKLAGYLLLNRARLCLYNDDRNELSEYHTFDERTMKRLSSNDKYIYLTSTHSSASYNGDEIILMNYNKEEEICKAFRDIIPSRINRGAGQLVGELTDLAAGVNNQVTIGYRFDRRREVGICVFNVTNDGKEWSCAKQLLLNDCWHDDVSYTPRMDWCAKLNTFILIEYITGHLIMIDGEGKVQGECRFMHAENRRDSPINITVSTNDYFCVRYESSITIHKLTS